MRDFASTCFEYEVENNTGVKQSKLKRFDVWVFIRIRSNEKNSESENESDSEEDQKFIIHHPSH